MECRPNYVFTRGSAPLDIGNVHFVSGDIAGSVRSLKQLPWSDIWLVGGGQINAVMLNAGLIDEIVLTGIRLVLGAGIPIFATGAARHHFETVSHHIYETGIVQWHLVKK